MSAEEVEAFEQKLKTDPQFREDFEYNRDLLESMRIHYKSALKNKLKQLDAPADDPYKKAGTRRFFQVTGIAAAIALLVGVGYALFFTSSDTQALFEQYYSPYYNVVDGSERSAGDVSGELAMRLYDQQRYEEALLVFKEAISRNPENHRLLFYKAMSHLSISQTDTAIANLQEVMNKPEERLHEPARWYLGLAYLQQGNVDKAKEIFATIESSNDSYSQRAGEILNALN